MLIESQATLAADTQRQLLKLQGDLDDVSSKYERTATELGLLEQTMEAAKSDMSEAQRAALEGTQTKLIEELKSGVNKLEARLEDKDKALQEAVQTRSFLEVQMKDLNDQVTDMKARLESAGLKTDEKKAPAESEWSVWQSKAGLYDALKSVVERSVSEYEAKHPAVFLALQQQLQQQAAAAGAVVGGPAAAADASAAAAGSSGDSTAAPTTTTTTSDSTTTTTTDGTTTTASAPAAAAVTPSLDARMVAVLDDLKARTSKLQATIDALSAAAAAAAETQHSLRKQLEEEKEVLKMRDDSLDSKEQLVAALKQELATKESMLKSYEGSAAEMSSERESKARLVMELEAVRCSLLAAVLCACTHTLPMLLFYFILCCRSLDPYVCVCLCVCVCIAICVLCVCALRNWLLLPPPPAPHRP
jgi:hypothetical protein